MLDGRIIIARNLREIVRLYGALGAQAYYAAVSHDAADVDAVALLGPVADAAMWEHIYEAAEAEPETFVDYAGDQVDEYHPLSVLAWWEDVVRDELGTQAQARRRATVRASADYLRSSITWMYDSNEHGDVNFIQVDQLIIDLQRCRSMLENVLKDGVRNDQGVPCMKCRRVLIKVYGESIDGEDDRWHCTRCDEWSTEAQYRLAVKHDYMRNATKLNSTDMREQYRVPIGTLTGWASQGKVRKVGRDDSGRQLYDVSDVIAMRERAHDTPLVIALGNTRSDP